MATHSSVLAWEIPWTKEPGGLQSMVLQRVRHYVATEHQVGRGTQQPDYILVKERVSCQHIYFEQLNDNIHYLTEFFI